jgi:hypothetical protein
LACGRIAYCANIVCHCLDVRCYPCPIGPQTERPFRQTGMLPKTWISQRSPGFASRAAENAKSVGSTGLYPNTKRRSTEGSAGVTYAEHYARLIFNPSTLSRDIALVTSRLGLLPLFLDSAHENVHLHIPYIFPTTQVRAWERRLHELGYLRAHQTTLHQ